MVQEFGKKQPKIRIQIAIVHGDDEIIGLEKQIVLYLTKSPHEVQFGGLLNDLEAAIQDWLRRFEGSGLLPGQK